VADLPERKRLFHDTPHWVPDGSEFFITINCKVRGKRQLTFSDTSKKILNSVRNLHLRRQWWCRICLLMPDHLHGIFIFPHNVPMSGCVSGFKSYQARKLGIRWQDGFFDHRLRSATEASSKAQYILDNPIRAGFCKSRFDWPHVWLPEPVNDADIEG
jgi:putative transposase